ncbi:MAG TPA: SCP2 sterol-binding domain-containing protein [Acidiferrobacterales bacterium]|nr:SCP2 sterol-binding domain-containing protein [Acidiferrobacterales bacterium]
MKSAQILNAILEDAGNRLLRLDPETLRRLGVLQGKVIYLEVVSPLPAGSPINIYLSPSEAGLRVLSDYSGKPDVTLRGAPSAFARLGLGKKAEMESFFARELAIEGDVELGQRFKRILDEMEIDWEEQASHFIGDVLAHKLGNLVRGAKAWGAEAGVTLKEDLTEYLQEESRMLPSRAQVEIFLAAVDTLRADSDRLTQRVQRLQGTPKQ